MKSCTTLGILGGLAIRHEPTNCYSVLWPIFSKTEDHIHKRDRERMSYNFTFIDCYYCERRVKNDYVTYSSTSTIFDISYSIYLFTLTLTLRLRYGDVVVRCLVHYTIQCGTYINCHVVTVLVPHE